jgi:hypothetical protein
MSVTNHLFTCLQTVCLHAHIAAKNFSEIVVFTLGRKILKYYSNDSHCKEITVVGKCIFYIR